MRKILCVLLLLGCAIPAFGQSFGTMNVDLAMPFTNSTPGTQLTGTILASGTSSVNCVPGGGGSTGCVWQAIPSGAIPTGELVGANGNGCSNLGAVQVNGTGGTLFPAQTMNGNNIAHLDTNNGSADIWGIVFGSGIRPTSMSAIACVTPGIPSIVVNNDFTDLMWIQVQSNGKGPLINLVNGGSATTCNSGLLGVEVEDPATGGTSTKVCVHNNPLPWVSGGTYSSGNQALDAPAAGSTGSIYGIYQNTTGTNTTTAPHSDSTNWSFISPAFSYWIALTYNSAASTGTAYVYTAQGALIGTTTENLTNNGAVGEFRMFSNENESDGGVTYISDLMLNWTNPTTPQFWSQTDPWAGVVGPERGITWDAGVPGGIPTITTQCITTACNTLASSVTAANIVSAMQSASANSYVSLPSGTASIGATTITSVAENVVLRGAGANNTILNCTGGDPCIQVNGGGLSSGIAVTPVSGQSGAIIQGQNEAIFASVSGLKIGNPFLFTELATPVDAGGIFVNGTASAYTGPAVSPGLTGPYSIDGVSQGYHGTCDTGITTCFLQNQVSYVTSCAGVTTPGASCTGTNVTVGFSPPIHLTNWSTTLSMEAMWSSTPAQYVGLEDFQVNGSGDSGADNIGWNQCYGCWVKGVASIDSSGNGGAPGHIEALFSGFDTVENSYFFLTQNHVTSSYGINCSGSSGLLIENNIFHAIASPMIMNGPCNDTVTDYNYDTYNYYTASGGYSQNFWGGHAGGIDTMLTEGNIANYANDDNIHGTSNLNSYFRNAFSGPMPYCWQSGASYPGTIGSCNNGWATTFYAFHRGVNLVGDVMGTTGINTTFLTTSNSTNNGAVLMLGAGNGGPPNDANVQQTATIWGIADSADGFGTPRFNCSDIGEGSAFQSLTASQAQTMYNPCPSSHTLPASFYYSSTPAWWPSGKPWPLIGPDVSSGNLLLCTGGTYTRAIVTSSTASLCTAAGGTTSAYAGGLANSNAAMDCYYTLGGIPSGTGSQLTNFNEATCYSAAPPDAANPSCAPGNLGGSYNSNVTLAVNCTDSSSGAIICFTTNGLTPGPIGGSASCPAGSTQYTTSITVATSQTIKLNAGGPGFSDSSVVSYGYVISAVSGVVGGHAKFSGTAIMK